MGQDERPQNPRHSSADDAGAWDIVAYLLSGMLLWGGAGWLLDRWLGLEVFLPVGLLLRHRFDERFPGYAPGDLLKLYIYGYLNRVQSSRRLEREAVRNVEVMWLLGRLGPEGVARAAQPLRPRLLLLLEGAQRLLGGVPG